MTIHHTPPASSLSVSAASDIDRARETLLIESQALITLSNSFDQCLIDALDILEKTQGRVIVCGMGKSGHVGRKIAATFASTGTPSFFVHPAEASHGDLGMLTPVDTVLALSNSGKTHELLDVLEYCHRFRLPLIAMTQNPDSPLGDAATVTLTLPRVPEACPNGLAPTTSTTLMMALGDVLAVCLLTRRGFSSLDFKTFHPGGSLGRRLLHVHDLMHGYDDCPLVSLGTSMRIGLEKMTDKRFGCVGVLDAAGVLVGIITDGDIRRHLNQDILAQPVERIMTKEPQVLSSQALAVEALAVMQDKAITAIFVVDDRGAPVGILNIHDCLKAGLI